MSYLRLEQITKTFGAFVANDHIDLQVEQGSIHALLGENGAGKTTLMNILCGLYRPDSGQIYLQDQPVEISSPAAAIQQGIGMIHQHFMLVPQLSVAENIILGTQFSLKLDLQQTGTQIQRMSETYGLAVDPGAQVWTLPVGAQQRVEILKALYREASVLVLDEPTAVLTPSEVQALFRILRQLAQEGHTIIFISHKLEEVMQICDAVTVLRRGQVMATTPISDTSPRQLAELMVGRSVSFELDKAPAHPQEVVLEVEDLEALDDRDLPALNGISFQLRGGEILGIAGVDGNGQRELAEVIAGLREIRGGQVTLQGNLISHKVRQQDLPLGFIPEDRRKMGLILDFTVGYNLILKMFQKLPFCRRFFLDRQRIEENASQAIQAFDIRVADRRVKVGQLSGGNQQKVVLAREVSGEPALLIAMQPTRGLDVGATEYVQQCLLAERDRGAAILYISTELEEVLAISDRIAVIYRGQFLQILEGATATREHVGWLMAGGQGSTTELPLESQTERGRV